jgi:hypothetical protein
MGGGLQRWAQEGGGVQGLSLGFMVFWGNSDASDDRNHERETAISLVGKKKEEGEERSGEGDERPGALLRARKKPHFEKTRKPVKRINLYTMDLFVHFL